METYTVTTRLGHVSTGLTAEVVESCLLDAIIDRHPEMTRRFDEIKSAIIQLTNDDDLSRVYCDSGMTVDRD